MSQERLKNLQETRLKLHNSIKEHADKREGISGDTETAEWRETWDKLNADYDANKADLDALNKQLEEDRAVSDRLSQIERETKASGNVHIGRDGASLIDGPANAERFQNDGELTAENLQLMALQGWMLHNSPGMSSKVTDNHRLAVQRTGNSLFDRQFTFNVGTTRQFQEARASRNASLYNALSVGTLSDGGALTGSTLVGSLERAMLDYSGVMQVADVIRTANGEPLQWPTMDDTGNSGRLIGENKAVTATAQPTTGQVLWSAYTFTSDELKVSRALLEDSVIDLPSVIGSLLGERLGRIHNTKYTVGTGGGIEPRGIVTAATAGVTATSATAIAFDELIDLEHSLDPSRRGLPGVGYMFNDSTLKALRKLKDGEGRYLWQSGANAGVPDMLNARPFWINQDMAGIATGAVSVIFGQFSQYKVRQVNQVRLQRLVERHAENDQDAFIAYVRGDGNLLDAGDGPVRKLTQA